MKPTSSDARTPGRPRLDAFMAKNGLTTIDQLAQVFRMSQTPVQAWLKRSEREPLEEVLPGPAMILFELMERGTQTDDLDVMRGLAAIHADPATAADLQDEHEWEVEIPTTSRYGARVVARSGHSIKVHPGWFRGRIAALEPMVGSMSGVRKKHTQDLLKRYREAIEAMSRLPR